MVPPSDLALLEWQVKIEVSTAILSLHCLILIEYLFVKASEDLKQALFMDSVIAGEASGFAMGLVMLGSGSESASDEMLQYAHKTRHGTILRGLAFIRRQEQADGVIEKLLKEKVCPLFPPTLAAVLKQVALVTGDPILRYGGIYTLAQAYVGTENNSAVESCCILPSPIHRMIRHHLYI
jgi:hypothetical protein